MKKLFIFLTIIFTVCSCTVQNSIYYWSDYKEQLARYTEKPDKSTRLDLEGCLLRIFSESVRQKKRVPPGLYIQYGYLMAYEGNRELALQYYELEKGNCPESLRLVNEMESKLK